MKQYRFTTQDHAVDATVPDAVLDANDPAFQIANGVIPKINVMDLPVWKDPQPNKAQIMRERNIKPGTDEWFDLWSKKG